MSERNHISETQQSPETLLDAGAPFLRHFGVEADPIADPESFRLGLQQLDPRYQGGRDLVRWQMEGDQSSWDDDSKQVIMDTAERMRMLETETPLRGDFDVVIILGGARQANLDRARYAMSAIAEGNATARHIVVAGSSRILQEAEQANAANYAPGANTEFDLCAGAAATVAREYPGRIASVMLIDDPIAGTPVIMEQVLSRIQENGDLPEGARIAAVTTQIYQSSTEIDLDRVGRQFGATETFTAGNPSDSNIVAKRTPATYLSEVLRTLRAAVQGVEAGRSTNNPEAVQTRVERIRKELTGMLHRTGKLYAALDTIDRTNPRLSRTITESSGEVCVIEASGRKWLQSSESGGLHYSGPDDMVGYYPE